MSAPPPPAGPPPGAVAIGPPPGAVAIAPPPPPASAPPPPPPKPSVNLPLAAAASAAAAAAPPKKRANAAAAGGSAGKRQKAANSPSQRTGVAKQSTPQIKPLETEETLFQRSLRNLGQSNLVDLLELVAALVDHGKRGESSASAREFLQKSMADETKWSGDYCASLLVPIYATQNSNTDLLSDVAMQNLSSRNTSARDLIERFLRPNWWSPPASGGGTSSGQVSPKPVSATTTITPAENVGAAAFALWATNQYAAVNVQTDARDV
ncbi:hypothetical protein BASA81_002670 [Batrachochytrium salamandrivorans]|nr:hypothetical protein BASA81_002670 [Batrachochytrium salamandrivorans]